MNQKYDTIVIGAGMVGVSTAIHLLQKGRNVLLLDKAGIAKQTSYGNSGIIESSYVLPFPPPHWSNIPKIMLGKTPYARINYPDGLSQIPWMLDFYWQSRTSARIKSGAAMRPLVQNATAEHAMIMEPAGASQYVSDNGRIKLHRTEESFDKGEHERHILKQYGVPFEVLSTDQMREIEPDIKPDFFRAIRLTNSKRYTNPARAIQAAAKWFTEQGGEYVNETVKSLRKNNDDWCVNEHQCKSVVICAGPWSNDLLKPLGHKFPFGVKRGYHKHYQSEVNIKHAIVDADNGYLICPMEQGIRITTGAEFAAMNTEPDPSQIDLVLPKAKQLVDLGQAVEEEAWMGTRPCLADSLPIIGQSHKHPGLWFNCGHGHCGITAGPASGRLVAELITGEKPFCNPAPYTPLRFRGGS